MRETDHVTLERRRLPVNLTIGDELELRIRVKVRRIEADEIDVSGFDPHGASAILHGDVYVESTILRVETLEPDLIERSRP